jgi:toxin HigB-1
MLVDFNDDELRRLYEDPNFVLPRLASDITKAYRKKMGLLVAATSELDLRAFTSLHFEKLTGDRSGQHSIRLNKQWRLIFRIERHSGDKLLLIIEIVDYH